VKSLHKVLDIIDIVAKGKGAGIRELSSVTGFPPATVHRIASTLLERRYFVQDPVTKKYFLSLRFLELGTRVQQRLNLTVVARPHLERLMAETKESVNLAVRERDEMVYLEHIRSDYSLLQLFTQPGARVPLYATGVGKLFLSRLNAEEFDGYLKRTALRLRTPNTLIERGAIEAELDKVRSKDYAVDDEEFETGVRCVAALVFDHAGRPVAAVSTSGPVVRISRDRIEDLGALVKNCASDVSMELGFRSVSFI